MIHRLLSVKTLLPLHICCCHPSPVHPLTGPFSVTSFKQPFSILRFFLIIPNPFQADAGLSLQSGSYKERLDPSKDIQIARFPSLQCTCSVGIQKESKRFSNCNSNLDFQALFFPPLISMFPSMLMHNEKQDLDSTFSSV